MKSTEYTDLKDRILSDKARQIFSENTYFKKLEIEFVNSGILKEFDWKREVTAKIYFE